MAFAMAILAISGCGKDEKEEPVPTTIKVTGVTLDRQTIGMTEGETASLAATVAPKNASDKSVTWSSNAKEVATVDAEGKVTVTAKPVSVTGVRLDKAELTLKEGESAALTATVEPVGATNKKVSWSSNNASVASVDAEGKVTAVSSGEAAIIVTTEDGGHTATCTVTVLKRATGVTLDKTSITIAKGGTAKLTATVTPYSAADKNVTWKSSDENIVTVDESGNVLGIGFGTTSVTVTTDDGGFTAACEVRVTLASPEITNAVAGEDNIKVEWNSVSGATSYEVGYKKTDASGWNVSGTMSGTSHTITGLEAGTSGESSGIIGMF